MNQQEAIPNVLYAWICGHIYEGHKSVEHHDCAYELKGDRKSLGIAVPHTGRAYAY